MAQPTPKSSVEVVLVALSTPILVGIYKEGALQESIVSEQKTSEALPILLRDIMQKYDISRVYFARGPGSFMSIKLVYIFLQTLRIAKGIELRGCDAFAFNDNAPIKATGNLFFVKENGTIVTKILRDVEPKPFRLPKRLESLACTEETSPLYILPAVKA